jgi:hypothetical protein
MKSDLLEPNTHIFKHFEKVYKKSEELQEIIEEDKKIMKTDEGKSFKDRLDFLSKFSFY